MRLSVSLIPSVGGEDTISCPNLEQITYKRASKCWQHRPDSPSPPLDVSNDTETDTDEAVHDVERRGCTSYNVVDELC